MMRISAAIIGLALSASGVVAEAPPAATAIAGGALDSRFPGAEVYLAAPVRAKRPAGKACAVAEAYVDHINAGQFRAVADLFADDALLLEPSRHTYLGMVQIRSFYEGKIGTMRPEVMPVAYLGDDSDCMVELAAKSDFGGTRLYALVSVDHFTLDVHGKVARMVAFARPPRAP